MPLSLAMCGTLQTAVETRFIADLPDAALVAPCDTANASWATNGELLDALLGTRDQRDGCAAQVDKIAKWRSEAAERAARVP